MHFDDYIKERDITYIAFAKRLGIHPNTLRNYAHGRRTPPLDIALAIELETTETNDKGEVVTMVKINDWHERHHG